MKPDLLKSQNPNLSVIIPCLNEEDTLEVCLDKLKTVAKNEDFSVEVIVADNGSKDSSVQIAKSAGARVVNIETKGYGAALIGGISEARAPFILMADADDSMIFSKRQSFFKNSKRVMNLCKDVVYQKGEAKSKKMPCLGHTVTLVTLFLQAWLGDGSNRLLMMSIVECVLLQKSFTTVLR